MLNMAILRIYIKAIFASVGIRFLRGGEMTRRDGSSGEGQKKRKKRGEDFPYWSLSTGLSNEPYVSSATNVNTFLVFSKRCSPTVSCRRKNRKNTFSSE